MFDLRFLAWASALVLGLSVSASAQSQGVDGPSRRMDVAFLDSLLGPRMTTPVFGSDGLAARDALIEAMLASGPLDVLDWACFVHGWLRSANDPHMRVPFDRLTQVRSDVRHPEPVALVDPSRPWSRFGPGMGIPPSARAAWLERTWPWVAILADEGGDEDVTGSGTGGSEVDAVSSSMEVVDHGAFARWRISSFGEGDDRSFRTLFRRCVRQLRRLDKPIMLDLRGNLGGYRSRRHAVLGAFVPVGDWVAEWEMEWLDGAVFEQVHPMPVVRVKRPLDHAVAVLLDGLSFSASLLLAQSLEASGSASTFGCAPLGQRGGCSGNPLSFYLPGSGLEVLIPTRQTWLGNHNVVSFGLPSDPGCRAKDGEWDRAVLWLLSSDLTPSR